MNTATHTPTPWLVSSDGRSIEAIDKTSNLPLTTICTFPNPAFPQDAGNAAFIVCACNAHHDLVKALKALIPLADEGAWEPAHEDAIDKAEAALRKAGVA